jgi:hypothetical protein
MKLNKKIVVTIKISISSKTKEGLEEIEKQAIEGFSESEGRSIEDEAIGIATINSVKIIDDAT